MRAKRLARYLQGTKNMALFYPRDGICKVLRMSSDTDWAGCSVTRKSVACCMGEIGECLLRSYVRTQQVIAKSSGEAEFYGLVDTVQEGLLLQCVLEFMGKPWDLFRTILEAGTDSSAAKSMSERLGVGPRVRHLEVSSLWIQDAIKEKHVKVIKLNGQHNKSDLGTKALEAQRFHELVKAVGCIRVDESKTQLSTSDIINMRPRSWDLPGAVSSYDVGLLSADSGDRFNQAMDAITFAIRLLAMREPS